MDNNSVPWTHRGKPMGAGFDSLRTAQNPAKEKRIQAEKKLARLESFNARKMTTLDATKLASLRAETRKEIAKLKAQEESYRKSWARDVRKANKK